MALDALVDSAKLDADLTSVANAIRTKGGTSAQLAFPADFVSAIAAIPSGGGGSGLSVATFTSTPAETTNTITFAVGDYTFPDKFYFFLKSDVTESDGVHISIYAGVGTNETTVPVVKRYRVYKADGGTNYYDGDGTRTIENSILSLKWNNNHYFLAGKTYTIQIYELDSTFFT